jgi:septal ring factor EnvC (AmiA/AmiB activator)
MQKIISIINAIILSLGVSYISISADNIDDIKLIDDSNKSKLKQTHIVGCNDHVNKKELTCSKEPEEIILSKLPTSSQIDETDFNTEKDIERIKTQLSNVMRELEKLKKDREEDKKIIEKLSALIEIITKEKSSFKKKITVKTGIENIVKKNIKKRKSKYIPKEIKVLERYDDHLVIEVQKGESLSSYAQAYYNDRNKYYRIYKANKDKINSNLEVIIGTKLIIPLTQ